MRLRHSNLKIWMLFCLLLYPVFLPCRKSVFAIHWTRRETYAEVSKKAVIDVSMLHILQGVTLRRTELQIQETFFNCKSRTAT
jgi:hypothetical protein